MFFDRKSALRRVQISFFEALRYSEKEIKYVSFS